MLSGLHKFSTHSDYIADLLANIKSRENPDLLAGNLSYLGPQFDGNDSIFIGYGFDLLVKSNDRIIGDRPRL